MTEIKINIKDQDQLNELVAATILSTISEESKNELVKNAIKELFTKEESPYCTKKSKSKIEYAFEFAIEQCAKSTINNLVLNDPSFKKKIDEVIILAFDKMFSEKKQLVNRLTDILVKGFELEY